jgi:MATE family multidrug resistance protein
VAPVRAELRKLASLSLPVAATQVSTMLMGFVDTVMVGRVSVDAIAAASLANVWIFGTVMFANGVIFGIDPIVAQAHGAGQGARAGLALQRGTVLALALSLPLAGLWLGTERFLLAVGQDPALAAAAGRYAVVQIPGIPFFLSYGALRQYLQGRELVRPAMWVILLANVWNALANWVLIFGNLGAPALGLVGAGIATTLTRVASWAGLLLWVRIRVLHRGAWLPWSRDAFDPRGLGAVVAIGLPVALQMSLEIWAFSGAAILAGWLGSVPLAAHTIALNMAALAFMMPLGISQGVMTRVGNLIGAARYQDAQRSARVAIAMGAGVMCFSAVAFVLLRHRLPTLYTRDDAVIALCATILPIAAAFQIFDGTQVVGCGVLRGMGQTRPASVFNLLGYWVLGLPLGGWLAFRTDYGLAGIWWGLCFGLGVVALLLVRRIARHGPATLAPPSPGKHAQRSLASAGSSLPSTSRQT